MSYNKKEINSKQIAKPSAPAKPDPYKKDSDYTFPSRPIKKSGGWLDTYQEGGEKDTYHNLYGTPSLSGVKTQFTPEEQKQIYLKDLYTRGSGKVEESMSPIDLIGPGELKLLGKLGSRSMKLAKVAKEITPVSKSLLNDELAKKIIYPTKATKQIPKDLEPYLSKKIRPMTKAEEIENSFLSSKSQQANKLARTTEYDPSGRVIEKSGLLESLNPLSYMAGDKLPNQWYRKIGSEKGIKSLLKEKAATAPIGSEQPYTYWGLGSGPQEGYRGNFALGYDYTHPEKMADAMSRLSGPRGTHIGSTPMKNGIPYNVSLEDPALSVYRRLPFTSAYKKLPKETLETSLWANPHLAQLQRYTENATKLGLYGDLTQRLGNSIYGVDVDRMKEIDGDTSLANSQPFGKPLLDNIIKKKGGSVKRKLRAQHLPASNQNIQSNINELQMQNKDLFGPIGKRRYLPGKQNGGWLDNY